MKIFLDTADLEEIRIAKRWGVLDGVTTNPTLYGKVGGSYDDILREICDLVPGPVSAEVVAEDVDGMLREGRHFAKLAPNVVVKVPITKDGLKAIRALSAERIRVNTTLIFSPPQALLAAKAGAAFVSPFLGRLDDVGHTGMDLVRQIRVIFDNYDIETEILAASIRHPRHVAEAAMLGADVATMPTEVLKKLLLHPLTDRGLDQFLNDWSKLAARSKVNV